MDCLRALSEALPRPVALLDQEHPVCELVRRYEKHPVYTDGALGSW